MQLVAFGDAIDGDDTGAPRWRMGAHARVAPRADLLRIDLELAAQAFYRAIFMSDTEAGRFPLLHKTKHF
jgi:hypothetical protein